MRRNSIKAKWGLCTLFVLAISSACQPVIQPTVSPAPFPSITAAPSLTATIPTVSPAPTSTAVATATIAESTSTPGAVLSPEQSWLMYGSKPVTLSLVNQDGSGLTFLHMSSSGEGPACLARNIKPYSLGDLPIGDGSSNRMIKVDNHIYIIHPPDTVDIYDPREYCQEQGISLRWKDQDDLLAKVKFGGTETVSTLFIYELPSMKVRERIPLIQLPNVNCHEKERPDICRMSNSLVIWSPDGRYLAFSVVGESASTDLYVYDSVNRTTRQLTSDPEWIYSFWWSPDTNLILFTELLTADYNSCVTSVSVVSRVNGQIKQIYKPAENPVMPDGNISACEQGLYEWVSNTKFLISDGGVRTIHDTGASNMRLVDANTGEVKVVFDERIDKVALDEQKKVMAIYTIGGNKYELGTYLVPIARPTPQFVMAENGYANWDETLQLFTAPDASNCKDQPHTITVFDTSAKISCMQQPTPERQPTLTADQRNVSPDKQWRVSLNEASVTLERVSDKSNLVVLDAPGTQAIWCPDSTCFFLVSHKVLYHVSLPDLAITTVDAELTRDTIGASWLEK